MKKVLVGMICDGKAGGIDKYLLNFYESVKTEDIKIDFLTNKRDESLAEYLKANGSELFEVASLMHPVLQYRQVKEIINSNGYDIVYMNISTALTFPSLLAARSCGVKKVIAHSHTSGYDCENGVKRCIFTALHYLLRGLVRKSANSYLCCSDVAAEWMFGKKAANGCEVIYNAVDTSKFSFSQEKRDEIRRELGIEDKFVIGNVGNVCYQKNHKFLIDAFYELQKTEPDAVLVIIGDGVLMPKLKAQIAKYGIEEKVKLLGRLDASRGYMSAFDVFALPSNFEGLGIVFIEAQYTHTPCVASDRVPRLAGISNMISFVPLRKRDWALAISGYKNVNREDFVFDCGDNFDLSKQKEQLGLILDLNEVAK